MAHAARPRQALNRNIDPVPRASKVAVVIYLLFLIVSSAYAQPA